MYKNKQNVKPDIILKEYWKDNIRFADFFNTVLFNGKQLIKPDELEDADTESGFIIENKNYASSVSAARDNIKLWKRFGVSLALLGIENQDNIHYGMPVRVMGYDYSAYKKQCDAIVAKNRQEGLKVPGEYLSGLKKTDRIYPVITVIIYYGQKSWDGAVNLYDMFNMPEEIKKFVNNYKITLIEAGNAGTGFGNKDNLDFFNIMGKILKCNRMTKGVKNEILQYCHDKDVDMSVVKAVAGASKANIDYSVLEKGEDIMYTLFEDIEREGQEKGKKEGRREGRKEGIMALIKICYEFGVPEEDMPGRICSSIDISMDMALDYLNEYKALYNQQ